MDGRIKLLRTAKTRRRRMKLSQGFTIVELLVVIVVIGILATITVVAYNGIQNRAKIASLQSDLGQSSKLLDVYKLTVSTSEQYPADLASAKLKSSGGTSYTYYPTSSLRGYCLEATTASITYSSSSTSPNPQSGYCITNSLIGWWTMNGNANDTSGNSNNGTVNTATLTTGATGGANGAYGFNGSNAVISAPATPSLNLSGSFAISAWVKTVDLSGFYMIVTKQPSLSGGVNLPGNYEFRVDVTTGKLTFGFQNNGSNSFFISAGSVVPGQWTNVVVSFEAGNNVSFYINGILSGYTATAIVGADMNSNPLLIGKRQDGHWFNGSIDDARVYNRAITSSEVQSLYNAGAQ